MLLIKVNLYSNNILMSDTDESKTDENDFRFVDSMNLNGPIHDMLKEAVKQPDLEFEWIYGDINNPTKFPLTKEIFLKLKHKLDISSSYPVLEETNDLDIRTELRYKGRSVTSNIRATIHGLQEIKQYCLQDNFDDLTPTFLKKKKYEPKFKKKNDPYDSYSVAESGLYPMRSTLKEEIKIDIMNKQVMSFMNNWSSKNKFFRYKKRYSYSCSNLWRIDLTAIKSSDTNTYSKTFKESGILQKKEQFELEIEYIGSISHTFEQPPIVKYSEILNSSPFNLELNGPFFNEGTILTDIEGTNNKEVHDMAFSYPLSPRYDEEVEFDEEIDSPKYEPYIPDKITIKDDFWKDSKLEDIFKHIKDNKKRFMNQDWRASNYKFIPLQKRYLVKSDWSGRIKPEGGVVEAEGEHILVRVSPTISIKEKDKKHDSSSETIIQTLLVPTKYIEQDMFEIPETRELLDKYELDTMEEYSPDSPRFSPNSQSGGGLTLSSTVYRKEIIDKLLYQLNEMIHFCYSCIVGSEYYLDVLQESDILNEYIRLSDEHDIYHREGWKFVGPQPVSMNLSHLNPLNSHSIVSKYVVTEKADGIRAQLLINKESRGYLLTPKKEIIDTGVNFEGIEGSWLFDGEYITQNKNKEPIRLFMIFDVYYSSEFSTQPYTYPWISKKGECRSEIIRKFKDSVIFKDDTSRPNSSIRIGFKQYLEGPEKLTKKKGSDTYSNIKTMFKSTKKILDIENNNGYEYSTDGLIFLPMYLSVKGSEEGDIVKSIRGTWNYNYKWKPPEENTIDFKVIFKESKPDIHSYIHETSDGRKETHYYQKVQLAVGYTERDDTMIDFNWSLLTNAPYNKQNYQYFTPPEFSIPNIHMTNIPLDKKRMKCSKDGKDIMNGCIVEMRYNPDSTNGFTWSPLRLRDDKVKPQYFTIANNIWNTINNPVTESMIRGDINFDEIEQESESDMYYVDTKFAEDTPIRALHNYIKSKLISRIGSSTEFKKPLLIADLSCGRGGDIKKYLSLKNDVGFILGLDISGNINQAAQRYHYERKPKPSALFLQFDTSKSIEEKAGCLSDDTDKLDTSKTMLDMIFKKSKSYPKKYKDVQKTYSGIATGGFDIVSSQFSLHYYFKDESTLRGFCENIRYLCSSGGYFIGTCYDGMKLMKTFAKQDTDTLEMVDSFGSLIYQINKKYTITDFSYDKDDTSDMYGQEIEVFMASIGQHITEYLVNFEFFIDIMSEYGFKLELPPFRKGEYNPIRDPIQSFDKVIDNLDEIREKDFNFVKKTNNRDLFDIKKDKGYQLLSGLNNWFVFQKE